MKINLKRKTQNAKFARPKTTLIATLTLLLLAVFCSALTASAQRRDHLTEQEAEQVRESQELDRRIDVMTKAIDRRFLILDNRQSELKDNEKWGEPKGTKADLLFDISKILQSSIDNIEYVAGKDAANKLFPKAVHSLADACRRYVPQLEAYKSRFREKMEEAAILTSLDYCSQVIEASSKVPKQAPKEEKKKKSSSKDN